MGSSNVQMILTLIWALLFVPALLWWKESVPFLVFVSVYANFVGHWAAWEAAKAKEEAETEEVADSSGQRSIDDPAGLTTKLGDAERTLEAITDVAAGEVGMGATAEQKLADAEVRLNRIYEIAKGEDA
jgi:hypothetical protein